MCPRAISTPRWASPRAGREASTSGRAGHARSAKEAQAASRGQAFPGIAVRRALSPPPRFSPMRGAMTVHFHEEDLPAGALAPGTAVAVDTETMGLITPRDRLCRRPDRRRAGSDEHLVRFGPGSDYAAPNLRAVLADPARVKLYHFARFDLAAISPLSRRRRRPGLLHQDRLAADPHLYRSPRPEGAGPRAARAGHLQAAAVVRLGGARAQRRRRSDYAASDVRFLHASCARSSNERLVARGAHRACAGLLRFPAARAPRSISPAGRRSTSSRMSEAADPRAFGTGKADRRPLPAAVTIRIMNGLLRVALPVAIMALVGASSRLAPRHRRPRHQRSSSRRTGSRWRKERMRVTERHLQAAIDQKGQSRSRIRAAIRRPASVRAIRSSASTNLDARDRRCPHGPGHARCAKTGRYDMGTQRVFADRAGAVQGAQQLRLPDRHPRRVGRPAHPQARQRRRGRRASCRWARFSANHMSADLGADGRSLLEGQARLHYASSAPVQSGKAR